MNEQTYQAYLTVLHEELKPALGCTEPIAIAYCAARARKLLGMDPTGMQLWLSSNMIKNAMGVTVPNSGGMRGCDSAAVLGMLGGDADAGLEVLKTVRQEDVVLARKLLEDGFCQCLHLEDDARLHIIAKLYADDEYALVEIMDTHLHVVRIEHNGRLLYAETDNAGGGESACAKALNIRDILAFAEAVELADVSKILDCQIESNMAIAGEGLRGGYGAQVGVTLRETVEDSFCARACASAAAASDARMNGCLLPVVINSGSGNQGITVSVPVIEYARETGAPRGRLYRALVISNLTAIHQKRYIGSLSAFCGATSAAAGAAAGITWLSGGGYEEIADSISNTIATVGGMVCDGAKSSCASKIATAVFAAVMGSSMSIRHRAFAAGEGIVKADIEDTIRNVGKIGRDGMRETDLEIIRLMLERPPTDVRQGSISAGEGE